MLSPTDTQRQRNRESQSAWERYASHRQATTAHILDGIEQGRLCVLGAGNCNDLAIADLVSRFAEVHLVDLDPEAVRTGVRRQLADAAVRISVPVDISGIFERLTKPTTGVIDIPAAIAAARTARPELPGRFDVTASVCLLTQLLEAVIVTVDNRHPQFHELLFAVRDRHLELLFEATRPGGRVVLITDVVSSLTCPELATIGAPDLPALLTRLLEQRNFFTGVNPLAIRQLWRTDARFQSLCEEPRLSRPWLWDFGPRTYAVVALSARRRQ